jgi:Fur family ferric uptake transcriptional regulator
MLAAVMARKSVSQVHEVALDRLRGVDQRYTRNRRLVVELLATAPAPSTISELLERDDVLAQSSTYRSLTVLEEAGVVSRIITTDDHARFELTEDVTGTHHHHLVCTGCGIVLDVTLPSQVEDALHTALAVAADQNAFAGEHHRVDLVGRCRACK